MSGAAVKAPAAYPSLLAAADTLIDNVDIVVEAPEINAPRAQELLRAAWRAPQPARTVRFIARRADLPVGHAGSAIKDDDGHPRAYACHRHTCSLPMDGGPALAQLLEQLQADAFSRNRY
jgi:uncharacterized protein YyaL (SSP411 family)